MDQANPHRTNIVHIRAGDPIETWSTTPERVLLIARRTLADDARELAWDFDRSIHDRHRRPVQVVWFIHP